MSDGTNGGSTEGASAPPAPRSVTTSSGTVTFGGGGVSGRSPAPAGGAEAGARPPSTPAERRRARREAYWNRPKPPKDWRYWVGGFGRALIVLGLLMFAFVAYQLWGTGIEEARAQNQLADELEQQQAELGTVPILIPASTAPASAPTAPPDTPAPGTTAPATSAPPPSTTSPPLVLSLPPIAEGDVLGNLSIPRIGVEKSVVAGVTVADLKQGPGHFPQTPIPGELGNAAIAGHRTTYGGPFLDVDELEPGDEITFTNLYSQQFVYTVTGSEIVEPSDGHVINTTDPSVASLTLITCTPVRTSKQRLVIHAELDLTRSPPPTAAQQFYGQAGSEVTTLPGDDVTLPAEPAAPDSTATPGSTVATEATTPAATTVEAGPTSTAAAVVTIAPGAGSERPPGFSDADPFAAGWFSDTAAWPQVIAWGLALVAWCIGCYLLARALRRRWVGWAVAVVPFVVLLYFWFQNVNRLLPPGI